MDSLCSTIADISSHEEADKRTTQGNTPNQTRKDTHTMGTTTAKLFEPMILRGLTIRNRIWMPAMDTYSADKLTGMPNLFHHQHYVSRAYGGFGMIVTEATAVSKEGLISPHDVGLWNDEQAQSWKMVTDGVHQAGGAIAVQLDHSGRKGSTGSFRDGYIDQSVPAADGGWQTTAPSPIAFGHYAQPRELTVDEIHTIVQDFGKSAALAVKAGFDAIQLHGAHGYLISQFLDPLTNRRTDEYGGSLRNRQRFLVELVDAVRASIPDTMPLIVRISATDWAENGWDLDQTINTARVLKVHGVDLMDVSSGGIVPDVTIPAKPGYQVSFAAAVRERADIPTTAVGLILDAKQAETILEHGEADAIEVGRLSLRDPYWPLRAAHELGLSADQAPYQPQYAAGAFR